MASMVKSVSVETQLAPAPTLSPMQQVIDIVQKLATAEGDPANAQTSAAATASPPQAPTSSRAMTIVLEPEDLGTVTVTMRMRGGSLDLNLDVANPRTLSMLDTAMGGQNYAVGTLTMRASDTQTSSQGSDNGTQGQGSGAQGSFASSGGGSQGGDGGQGGAAFSGGAGTGSRGGAGSGAAGQAGRLDPGPVDAGAASGLYI
jgi:chemotaxis protein MotD